MLFNHITWMIIRNMLTLNSITYTYHRFIQFLIFSRKTQNCSLMRFCCCRWVISYSIKDLRAENAFQCDYTHQCDFRAIFPWKQIWNILDIHKLYKNCEIKIPHLFKCLHLQFVELLYCFSSNKVLNSLKEGFNFI